MGRCAQSVRAHTFTSPACQDRLRPSPSLGSPRRAHDTALCAILSPKRGTGRSVVPRRTERAGQLGRDAMERDEGDDGTIGRENHEAGARWKFEFHCGCLVPGAQALRIVC